MLQTRIERKKHTKYISEAQINCNVCVTSKFFLWSCWTSTVGPSFVDRLKNGSINAASEIRSLFFDVWIYMEDNSTNRVQLNWNLHLCNFRFKNLRWGARTSNNSLRAILRRRETCAHVCDGEIKRDQANDYIVFGEERCGVDSQESQVWVETSWRDSPVIVERWHLSKEVESLSQERSRVKYWGEMSQEERRALLPKQPGPARTRWLLRMWWCRICAAARIQSKFENKIHWKVTKRWTTGIACQIEC